MTAARSRLAALLGRLCLAITLVVAPFASAGLAQQSDAPVERRSPAYEADLMRLAEVMGTLAFLRDLCGADDAADWPARMQELLEAEGPERAPRLAGAYNRGFSSFALTYTRCTPAAERAIARFLAEGDALSRMIATRYGS
ncbi:MAG: TIGR02301 family protein [Salinarimonas sp.]